MNIHENLQNKGKIVKNTINNWFQYQTNIKAPLLHVLYGNCHICIFMNINENLNEGKTIA